MLFALHVWWWLGCCFLCSILSTHTEKEKASLVVNTDYQEDQLHRKDKKMIFFFYHLLRDKRQWHTFKVSVGLELSVGIFPPHLLFPFPPLTLCNTPCPLKSFSFGGIYQTNLATKTFRCFSSSRPQYRDVESCNVRCHFHLERLDTFPKPPSPPQGYLSLSNSNLSNRAVLSFPLLTVMRSCNSLSVSSARSLPLSLSPLSSLSLLHKETKLRQLAYKIADSIIQLHNQDKGDGGQEKGKMWRLLARDGFSNSSKTMMFLRQSSKSWRLSRDPVCETTTLTINTMAAGSVAWNRLF